MPGDTRQLWPGLRKDCWEVYVLRTRKRRTGDPCRSHAPASWLCLLRSWIKPLSSLSSEAPLRPTLRGRPTFGYLSSRDPDPLPAYTTHRNTVPYRIHQLGPHWPWITCSNPDAWDRPPSLVLQPGPWDESCLIWIQWHQCSRVHPAPSPCHLVSHQPRRLRPCLRHAC